MMTLISWISIFICSIFGIFLLIFIIGLIKQTKANTKANTKDWEKTFSVKVSIPIFVALLSAVVAWFGIAVPLTNQANLLELEHYHELVEKLTAARLSAFTELPEKVPQKGFPVSLERACGDGLTEEERATWMRAQKELSTYITYLEQILNLIENSNYLQHYLKANNLSEHIKNTNPNEGTYGNAAYYMFNRNSCEHYKNMHSMAINMRWIIFEDVKGTEAATFSKDDKNGLSVYSNRRRYLGRDLAIEEESNISIAMG